MRPTFVESKDKSVRAYGVGKLVEADVIQYFISPADPPIERVVAAESIFEVELKPQERVFYRDRGAWRVGRLEAYTAPDELGVRLPNKERARVRVEDAFVRCNLPLESPLSLLQERNTETAFWHEGRASFVRALAEQRAVYRGLAALASANVEILGHQLTVVHRVLTDPVPRYLLADEVGLGKTIEAGLIIKQHISDEPDRAQVLVAVPENLVAQWETEFRDRIRLEVSFQVQIVGHSELSGCAENNEGITLLVIDEAHQVARYAYEFGGAGEQYRAARNLAERADGVLLLSATPVLHNEEAFLGMLHLLDPETHSLEDIEGFRRRVAHREVVATAVRDLDDEATGYFVEPALEQLTPLLATSPQLTHLVAEVTALLDNDPDDPDRQQAIATLRAHLQECYRIDRRLLRTRRAQERVKDDLPRREYAAWELEDSVRLAAFEWLDLWRFRAVDASDVETCQATFIEFLEAGLTHPTILAAAINRRRAAIEHGDEPLFEDEAAFLATAPPPTPVAHDRRIGGLANLVQAGPKRAKWVVFISDPAVADEVARVIGSRVPTQRLTADATAVDTLARFRDDAELAILICDESGEHGVNLQGLGATLVHFDLPLSPNRIEQRIGRLDRLGGDRTVTSYVPIVSGSCSANWETAWAGCLRGAVGAFTRSVASLQHVLDAGLNQLRETAIVEGIDAIDDLSNVWLAAKGPLSLSQELRRVESQDLLDQLDDDQSDFFDAIDDYEYATEPSLADRFSESVCKWAANSLHFERHWKENENDDGPIELEHTRHTLLAANHAARLFTNSLAYLRRRRGLCTGWMGFDRDHASHAGVPLARIGHPFIEDLHHLTEWEDRGRAYAYWRVTPDYEHRFTGPDSEELFFRFDFVVEPNTLAVAEQAKCAGLSIGAVARRAQQAFKPVFCTIWVDLDGAQVTDALRLDELNRPYGDTDTNLRDSRWEEVDDLGLVANWSRVCEHAEAAARRHLGEAIGLTGAMASAIRHVEDQARRNALLLEARLAVSQTHTAERNGLEVERKLGGCLRTAVKHPRVRLDAVGALFVSARNLGQG